MLTHRSFLLALAVAVIPAPASAARVARANRTALTGGMARITGGVYRPLYATRGAPRTRVATFALDRMPVTRGSFLQFVTAHPQWRRGAIRPVFAEAAYLADWPAATSAGDSTDSRRPVTGISWFAARAYCAAQDKRLPTVDEWEYAASASETRRHASDDTAFRRRLLALYAARKPERPPVAGRGLPNMYGVYDLHGVVWEWTLDFNSVVVGDDSRTAGSGQDARDHHLFCASAAIGATDPSDFAAFARSAVRAGLTARSTVRGVGFRCALDLPG